ncbi:hypothetical protein DY000_02054543 [Brassica cretica]|uniref:Uncharacterized protein n=1 Tax=Brassica cretica TaxID=69181 RepID=A0ABQ7ABI7_BRACR|nr:hypothetical protein DY000_02054543 [Brassica cretica]
MVGYSGVEVRITPMRTWIIIRATCTQNVLGLLAALICSNRTQRKPPRFSSCSCLASARVDYYHDNKSVSSSVVSCVRLPSSGLQQIFQVLVEEERLGILDLTCPISRSQGTESSKKESTPFLRPHSDPVSATYQDRLLGWTKSVILWPSSEIGFSDTKRFYMVIYFYCELAICDSHRWITAKDLSNFELEIVQVAIESLDGKDPPSLKSKADVIYTSYKDLAKGRTGEPYHCQAVVRRVINKATGTLSIQGDCWIEEVATASAASKKRS